MISAGELSIPAEYLDLSKFVSYIGTEQCAQYNSSC
jgi:hypothetical protein